MRKILVIVDVQNDFVNGSLGTPEAVSIIPNLINKIKNWDGDIIFTKDTHTDNYLKTAEGKKLPVEHCIEGTNGHCINEDVFSAALNNMKIEFSVLAKRTFGSTALPEIIAGMDIESIELVGLCTDICVISNALILKAHYSEIPIIVDASCCAGVTPEKHRAALEVMKSCQIDVIGE